MKTKAAFCTPNSVSQTSYDGWASAILLGDDLECRVPEGRLELGPALLETPSCEGHLAPDGVCHAPSITLRTVRSYRTFSPLPCYRRFIFCGTFHHRCNPMHKNCFNVLVFTRHPAHGVRTFLSTSTSGERRSECSFQRSKRGSARTLTVLSQVFQILLDKQCVNNFRSS
jgi:hypothetical protein